jgi:hypothetical protein
MGKPKGLSFYKRLQINRFISVNPSTNGLSVSIGVPGARLVVPVVSFTERPPMVNVQKYGIRYRRHFVSIDSLLDQAKLSAEDDLVSAATLYRKAARYASTDAQQAEMYLGKGYTGKRNYSFEGIAAVEDYRRLGASIKGDYAAFLSIIEDIRKK